MSSDPNGHQESSERREVVLHPRTAAARRFDRSRVFGSHVRGHTVNTEEVLNLVAAQRRTSLKHLAVVGVPLLIFMTALKLFPSIGGWRIGTLPPVPWLVLGPVILFSIVAVAAVHERRARRIEDTWSQGHRETAR